MTIVTRRRFIGTSAALATATLAGGAKGAAGTEDIRVAVVGFRGRGRAHIHELLKNVVALCDVDQGVLDAGATRLMEKTGREIERFTDYRRLLERDDIDAIAVATPNHTHALIAVAAAEAGKHVYLEKPVSHNVWEGRQIVAAANKHNVLIQCGTQSRSSPSLKEAVAFVAAGNLGRVRYAIGTCYKPRMPIGKLPEPLSIPDAVDYDLWCGPAEKRSLFRPQLHYDWHWDSNTGNGDMGNQGIHQMDIARWFLGEQSLPKRVVSVGGRLGYDDAGDTPNTQTVLLDYQRAPLVFETRGLPKAKQYQADGRTWARSMDRYRGSGVGVVVQCEKGHVLVPSYVEAIAFDTSGEVVKHWKGGGNHFHNWLDAIAAGDASRLNGPILEGHLSSAMCHLGGISHTLGEAKRYGEVAERHKGDPLFSGSLDRMAGHLRANDVEVDQEAVLTAGAVLELGPAGESFIGNAEADALLTRDYRSPFVVPDVEAQA